MFFLPLILAHNSLHADPFAITQRLAMTPTIDGKFDESEWDPIVLTDSLSANFQWEPGQLYFSGIVPAGKIFRARLDLNNDGFLKGSDNVELMFTQTGDGMRATGRVFDAESKDVHWTALPMTTEIFAVGSAEGDKFQFEARFNPRGFSNIVLGQRIGLDIEGVDSVDDSNTIDAFNGMQTVQLSFDRSEGLPTGVEWANEFPVRTIVPGESADLKFKFTKNEAWSPTRAIMKTNGWSHKYTAELNLPFPNFDKKNRAWMVFPAKIPVDAQKGYTVVQCSVTDDQGQSCQVLSSFKIADALEQSTKLVGAKVDKNTEHKSIRVVTSLKSNTGDSLKGKLWVEMPEGWEVFHGNGKNILIYHSRGTQNINMTLLAPKDVSGLVPIKVRAEIGDKKFEREEFLVIP